ncbi:MAG: LPS export ABC transporter periplasmic protein LptC [Methylotenera sp.]|nr:LPS export ABC transporter periplasmic protein LptC [Methylotenera sp.]
MQLSAYLHRRVVMFFPLVLLLLLAVVTFWINKAVQTPKPKIDGSSRHDPDYMMHNFVTTQTDVNGQLRYKLTAAEMVHYPDDDTTQLQRPRYTQFAVQKPYTSVEGLRGYVSSNGEEIELVDDVKITRQAFADKGEMTVETDYLNIRPNDELVSTQSPVVIKQAPNTVVYATGMIYDKKTRTVTLLNKVRAHYEKPKKSTLVADALSNKPSLKTKQTAVPTTNPSPNTDNARIRRRYE